MNPADETERSAWRARLGAVFTGRKVITGLLPLAGLPSWVRLLDEAGAQRPLLLGTGRGAGPVPTEEDAEIVLLDPGHHESMTAELRAQDALARQLPAEVVAAIERYDPDGEAVWLLGPFVVNEPVLGRPVYGGRPADWLALEDKLLAEGIWRAVGAPHAPARVVPVDAVPLEEASRALDLGAGVVWAGDARDGFNGGGDFTRWVVSAGDRLAAWSFFGPRCDRVRVMPFLDGVPCSVHGIVLPDGTAAFRPVELAIMRGPGRRFVYGGQGTSWDPPEADREQMRDLVRRVGEHLRRRCGYRGAFGIDGVLTRDGFRPTELNTRAAGGLATLAQGVDPAAFTLLQLACLAGHDPGITVAELEGWALPAMDADRVTKAIAMVPRRLTEESVDLPVLWDGADLRPCPALDAEAAVMVGPSAVGSFTKVTGVSLARGERLGALNAALVRFLDAELDAGVGPVEAAPDLRAVSPTA
ncbi:hypothetical protein [Nocardioides mesophilus]|uniref:ATP-grasp domain-containing protein n=1 Tax=Nocardioides mesophilus TaxID=433659 RepID=A0A7G9RBY8_9ACTN|nr:hypothetical protein [Nocardioides mesophilus]QNN53113.1 hypothetical protein H9L09_01010 [Nocardioides mesophilus]